MWTIPFATLGSCSCRALHFQHQDVGTLRAGCPSHFSHLLKTRGPGHRLHDALQQTTGLRQFICGPNLSPCMLRLRLRDARQRQVSCLTCISKVQNLKAAGASLCLGVLHLAIGIRFPDGSRESTNGTQFGYSQVRGSGCTTTVPWTECSETILSIMDFGTKFFDNKTSGPAGSILNTSETLSAGNVLTARVGC